MICDGIYTVDNPYGYKINVSHPQIRPLYERFKIWKGIPTNFPPSEDQREEFEEYILGKVRKASGETGVLP